MEAKISIKQQNWKEQQQQHKNSKWLTTMSTKPLQLTRISCTNTYTHTYMYMLKLHTADTYNANMYVCRYVHVYVLECCKPTQI